MMRLTMGKETHGLNRFPSFSLSRSGWVKQDWLCLFEELYIDHSLLAPLLDSMDDMLMVRGGQGCRIICCPFLTHLPPSQQLHHDLSVKASMSLTDVDQQLKQSQPPPALTQPQPFKLTRPRARAVVVPEPLPFDTVPKARPIPGSTYATPLEQQALERRRQLNRERAQKQ